MRCFSKLLDISYRDHITNEEVKAIIGNAIGLYEDLLTSVKRCKLKWFRQITRSSGLAKTIPQGTVQGVRQTSRQRKRWEDKEWTGLEWNVILQKAENREEWRKLVVKSTAVPQQSARLTVWMREMRWEVVPWYSVHLKSGRCGIEPHCPHGAYNRTSPTNGFKTGTLVAALPGAWCHTICAKSGWPSISNLWLGEIAS